MNIRLTKLISRKAKEDKEKWLGQYCEETVNQHNQGNTEKSCKHIRNLFG